MVNIDKLILSYFQKDSSTPVGDLAERVGLSTTPCWRRIQKMEGAGIIRARVALLDGQKLNAGVTVFVAIRTSEHNAGWLGAFLQAVIEIPEVVEF